MFFIVKEILKTTTVNSLTRSHLIKNEQFVAECFKSNCFLFTFFFFFLFVWLFLK